MSKVVKFSCLGLFYPSSDIGGKPMVCNEEKLEKSMGKQPLQLCFIPKELSPQAPVAFKNE